jgi:hypothetical protein
VNADRAPQLKANVMWLRDSSMKYLNGNRIRSILLLPAMVCVAQAVAGGAKVQQIKLTDHDRASIIGSVARDLFKTGRNYEGKHFILADGIRSEWIPKIAGYDVTLVSRDDIETVGMRVFYYVVQLRALRRSVHVTVTGYDSETKNLPHVVLHYSFRRAGNQWRGKYLWGAGD